MMMMMIPVVVFVCAPMFNKEKKSYKESCIFFIHFLSEKRIFLLTFRINITPRGKSKLKYKKMKQRRTVSNLKCFHILLHLYCFHFFCRHHTTHLSTFPFYECLYFMRGLSSVDYTNIYR